MTNPNITTPFYFKDKTHQELVLELNKKIPVNLRFNMDLVDKVSERCPMIEKGKVGRIIMAAFQTLRELLVLGEVINFNNFFYDSKLHFFKGKYRSYMAPAVKVKMSTPISLKEI